MFAARKRMGLLAILLLRLNAYFCRESTGCIHSGRSGRGLLLPELVVFCKFISWQSRTKQLFSSLPLEA